MTALSDDEIMELAGSWFYTGENQKRDDGYYYRSLGTPSNVRGSDLIEFARALLAAQPAVQQPAEDAPSDAMVDAYLTAQRAAVEEADRFGRPNAGGLHTNTVREACRAGLAAAIKAQGGKQ